LERVVKIICSACGNEICEIAHVPGVQIIGCSQCNQKTEVKIEENGHLYTILMTKDRDKGRNEIRDQPKKQCPKCKKSVDERLIWKCSECNNQFCDDCYRQYFSPEDPFIFGGRLCKRCHKKAVKSEKRDFKKESGVKWEKRWDSF